jgi:hypothetical protein
MSVRRKFHAPTVDHDVFLAWAIIVFIAFLGIAAVGFYAGLVSGVLIEQPGLVRAEISSLK